MQTNFPSNAARTEPGGTPRDELAKALADEFDGEHVTTYAARLLGAFPVTITAPPLADCAWQSALVGPARYPSGYRDVVILARGRLWPASVRQRHRDGNLHKDPVLEIDRAFEAVRTGIAHADRGQRPLIPSILLDGAWLLKAARSHDIPVGPELIRSLLENVRPTAAATKAAFRKTLDPSVAKLLREDESLQLFHDWLADETLGDELRSRRRAAYQAIGAACGLLTAQPSVAARLDAGEAAISLLVEILDAQPEALRTLLEREPTAFSSLDEARQKAWAIELLTPKQFDDLDNDLDVAGGWAGRVMSFAAVATSDPVERRQIARAVLEHGRLKRFEPHNRDFKEWKFDEGRLEFAQLLGAVVKYGILPEVMSRAEQAAYPVPTPLEIDRSIPELARIISVGCGTLSLETARRRWREVGSWLPKNAAAAAHQSRARWPALIDRFETERVKIDCLASSDALMETVGKIKDRPAILYNVLAEGCHVLRLRDHDGLTVALTTVMQAQLEEAATRGNVVAGDLRRDGWSSAPQWKRWMRVEVGRLIHAIATGKAACDLKSLRQSIDRRAKTMRVIETMTCGFDHRNAEARELAQGEIASVLHLLVRKHGQIAVRLFGSPPDPSLEADRAWLNGEPEPHPKRHSRRAAPDQTVSPLLRPDHGDVGVMSPGSAPATLTGRYFASDLLNNHRLRPSAVGLPKDISKTRFIIVDVETTGLSEADRIVEIAAIEMRGLNDTARLFHAFVNPGMAIPEPAILVHGITDEMVKQSPPFSAIAPKFLEFITGDVWFVAHNAEFDVGVINRELLRAGQISQIDAQHALCTMNMAGANLGQKQLDKVCDALGIDRSKRKKHGALTDARLCGQVFSRLLSKKRN